MHDVNNSTEVSQALDAMDRFMKRFVAFPSDSDRYSVVLWAAHTHLLDCFDSTPRLVLSSPEKQSGKSRCLEVLTLFVPEALHASSISPAAMFRRIAQDPRPTLLLDEYDTVWNNRPSEGAEELRALVNGGHRRGASTWRCSGSNHEVREFPIFAAVALAGIGYLPDTIVDRSVVIKMRRRGPGEHVEQFRYVYDIDGYDIRDQFTEACEPYRESLQGFQVENPLADRAADVWEPLLIIGEIAGGHWKQRSLEAALAASNTEVLVDSVGVELLKDVRKIWPPGEASLEVSSLLKFLISEPEMRWGEFKGKPLTARGLAQLLKSYGIKSSRTSSARFYHYREIKDVWDRYLPSLQAS